MNFEEAMTIMRNGGKVRRPCWKSAYIFLAHSGKGPLCLVNAMPSSKKVYFISNVTSECIVYTDWEEVRSADKPEEEVRSADKPEEEVLTVGEKIAREVEAWSTMDMSEYNFSTKDIFDEVNKAKSLNQALVKKEDEVAAAMTKRIMGEIDTQELSRIADEACDISMNLMHARVNLKNWSRILVELKQSIDNVERNANLTEAEIDVLIGTARIFSRIDKEEVK